MNTEKQSLPNLVVSINEASEKIQARIDKGQEILDLPIPSILSESKLEGAKAEYSNWSAYNLTLLSRLFDNSAMADRYDSVHGGRSYADPTLVQQIKWYRKEVTEKINCLKSILGELELIPERIPGSSSANSNEVFIVHGHDRAAKSEVARFVEKLGLKVTILDEQPGGGKTIIEKFEKYASNAGFAIVLLTPDDVGAAKDKRDNLNPRARQNVIFEMGYFVKGLGRGRVCAMSTEEVEIPSDLAGVEYIHLDGYDGWKSKLARELEAAGISIDTGKLV